MSSPAFWDKGGVSSRKPGGGLSDLYELRGEGGGELSGEEGGELSAELSKRSVAFRVDKGGGMTAKRRERERCRGRCDWYSWSLHVDALSSVRRQ